MINYSTFYSTVKTIFLLAVFQMSFAGFAFSQQCAPTIDAACNGGFMSIGGDFGTTVDCPASITVSDGTNSVVIPLIGGCKTADESYILFVDPAPFDCAATSITIDIGTEVCDYDTPDGVDGNISLPVEIGSVSAKLNDGKITLTWLTYTELNNDYFTIERSTDGINFEAIAEESGAGTTFEEKRYSFTDAQPANGLNYYRLSQTDFDGTSERFPVLSVDTEFSGNDQMELFPNPANGSTNLAFSDAVLNQQAIISVFDLNGKLVRSRELFLEDSLVEMDLANIPAGMYLVTAQVGRQVLRKKLSIY